ncbi:NAD(P)-binding protein [Wolfiporia cocos MD-104 SS10]|uniref:NAD(P)-binding protein n=1 Tax=Wolfiporia cocos (strain MD-104) TaxID=742152 RepID=A0A2H3JWG7_WOLCO|nr:NAD(P)-binding protein [Wolfiporia cocos MD-104 SS10]
MLRILYEHTFPPKPVFNTEAIPNLKDRVVIVTGGNSGIGKETIRVLLLHNATVYMACRNVEKAQDAIVELKNETGKEAIFLELDLSSVASIRAAAEKFLRKEKELHILYNNAGIISTPMEQLTEEGYDLVFGTNVLGHHLFTTLLLPALAEGASSSPDQHTRVIWVSSIAAYFTPTIHWNTLRDGPERRKVGKGTLYNQSKLAAVILARQYAKRYADRNIVSFSVDPGIIRTDIMRHVSRTRRTVIGIFMKPVSYGALTQLWAGTMPETLKHNGEYLIPWARIGDPCRKEAYDDELGQRLWQWLEKEISENHSQHS